LFKLLIRLFCLGVLLIVGFVALSLMDGGKWFRRFGDTVKEKSDWVGGAADVIKETADGIRGSVSGTVRTIKETGGRIKGITAETTEKAGEKLKETGEKIGAMTAENPEGEVQAEKTGETGKAAAADNDKDP
jgi:hypothetical protein